MNLKRKTKLFNKIIILLKILNQKLFKKNNLKTFLNYCIIIKAKIVPKFILIIIFKILIKMIKIFNRILFLKKINSLKF